MLCALPALAWAQPCPEENLGNQVPQTVQGSTLLRPNLVDPDPIGGLRCFSVSPDATFLFTAPSDGVFRIDTFGSEFDTVLHLRDATCDGSEILCVDDVPPLLESALTVQLFDGQSIVIVVDGFNDAQGQFRLNIAGDPPPTPTVTPGPCPLNDLGSRVPNRLPLSSALTTEDRSSGTCGGEFGLEAAFAFQAPSAGLYTFIAPNANALYVRDAGCDGAELGCGNVGSPVSVVLAQNQVVAVIVDGFDPVGTATSLAVFREAACPAVDLGDSVPASSTYDPTQGLSSRDLCFCDPFAGVCAIDACGPQGVAGFLFTPPSTDVYTINTFGSADDTGMLVIAGDCDGTILQGNDDAPYSLQSEVSLELQQGADIVIAVAGARRPVQVNVMLGTPTPRPTPPAQSLRAYVANQLHGSISVINVPPRTGLVCGPAQPCPAGTECVMGACLTPPLQLGTICLDQVIKRGTDVFPRVLRISQDAAFAYVGGHFSLPVNGMTATRTTFLIADTCSVQPFHPDGCTALSGFPALPVADLGFEALNFSLSGLFLTPDELSIALTAEEKDTFLLVPNPLLAALGAISGRSVGDRPTDVVLSSDGTIAYVSNAADGTLSVLDLSGSDSATVQVGLQPTALGIAPDGALVYVANSGDDSISIVDAAAALNDPLNAVIATVPVGAVPSGLAVAGDGQSVWVTNAGANSVSIVDVGSIGAGTPAVQTLSAVGEFPARIALTPDDEFAYLTNFASGDGDGFVSVIDAQARSVLPFRVPVGRFPVAIQIAPPPPTKTPTPTNTSTPTATVTRTPSITPTVRFCQTGAQCLPDAPVCQEGICISFTPTRTGTPTPTASETRTRPGFIPPRDCCGTIDCGFAPFDCDCSLTCHALQGDCASEDRCLPGNGPLSTVTITASATPTATRTVTRSPSPSVTATVPTRTATRTRTRTATPLPPTATRTGTRTATALPPTATVTSTRTATVVSPAPTRTRTPTMALPTSTRTPIATSTITRTVTPATPTPGIACSGPTAGPLECLDGRQGCVDNRCVCLGDCNADGIVRGGEITTMVAIINGERLMSACRAADRNGDGIVRGSEVTVAVVNVNSRCP